MLFLCPCWSINRSRHCYLRRSTSCTPFFFLAPTPLVFFPTIVIIKSLDNRITQSAKKKSFILTHTTTRTLSTLIFFCFFFPAYNIVSRIYIFFFQVKEEKIFLSLRWRTTMILLDIFDDLIERFICMSVVLFSTLHIIACLQL